MRLTEAAQLVLQNAAIYQHKNPTLGTLLEEVAELARALEGKHEHPPELELVEIGGIVLNMLTRYATAPVFREARDVE